MSGLRMFLRQRVSVKTLIIVVGVFLFGPDQLSSVAAFAARFAE